MVKTGWLLREGDVVASAELADGLRDRARGLLGLDDYDGALLLRRTRSVHTAFMRFAIDVAFLDRDDVIVRVTCLRAWRWAPPRRRVRHTLEAKAGEFERWGLRVGDRLEFRETP